MKKVLSILLLALTATTISGIPAYRGGIVRTDAEGKEKTVYLHGNAVFHYMTDAEGNWLDEETLLPLSAEERTMRTQAGHARIRARRIEQEKKVGIELNLAPRGLLILANFKDVKFTTSIDTIHEMVNGEHFTRSYDYSEGKDTIHISSSGSVRQYFHDQSWGQYNPVFDVVGPVELPQDMKYYGANNDINAPNMIKDACLLADQAGVDFTQYDNDNDGQVDFVYVLYAGYGEADGGEEYTVWPHNYSLSTVGKNCYVDGKQVDNYACSNELNYTSKLYNGIGTICHEFSHVLGLPDLYETNDPNSSAWKNLHTLLQWDILDAGPYNNGGNTPPSYSAYERFFCGWITPYVLAEPEYIRLYPLEDSRQALIISATDTHNMDGIQPDPKDFYILECRKKEGWDQYLPGRGLLITRIRFNRNNWIYNEVNNKADNMGVDLMEARANTDGRAKSSDAFPAGAKNWYGGTDLPKDYDVTDIKLLTDGSNGVEFSYRYAARPPQGIEDVQSDKAQWTKVLRDGILYLVHNGAMYNVQGVRVK